MVCPYRIEKIYERNIQTDVAYSEKEMFCDCYGKECPFYDIAGRTEMCKRAIAESRKGKQ